MGKLRLRCSALPLAFTCPGSVRAQLKVDETSDHAELGTAAHAALAILVETGRVDWAALPALAKRHGVDETDLRVLVAQGRKLWLSEMPDSGGEGSLVRDCYPDAVTEVELEHEDAAWILTGHADILGADATTIRVADWKGGRVDKSFREQLIGYAALALIRDPGAQYATADVLWVRDQDVERYSLSHRELDDWRRRIDTEIVGWDGTYRAGPHCYHCPRGHECPARHARLKADLAIVADRQLVGEVEDADTLSTWTAEAKIDLLEKARVASKLIERVLGAIREDVVSNGGEVSDGKRRLTLVTEQRRSLDPIKAIPLLQDAGFTDEELASVIEMSAAKAENVVSERAPKRGAAAARRELAEKLDAADAIIWREQTKMVQRRA